jgi:hypothetical protein
VAEMMMVNESFSGTEWVDGEVEVPDLNKDGGRQWNPDGSLKVKQEFQKGDKDKRTGVPIPTTLNQGKLFPKTHKYVKLWPQFFDPVN